MKKVEGITQRFEKKIEAALIRLKAGCEKQKRDPQKHERQIGRLLGKNSRAEKLYDVDVIRTDQGSTQIDWSKIEATRD